MPTDENNQYVVKLTPTELSVLHGLCVAETYRLGVPVLATEPLQNLVAMFADKAPELGLRRIER